MRLIDADKLYSKVKTEANPYGKPTLEFQSGCLVLDIIENAPTIDAVPVVRGEWIRMDETQALLSVEWKCSQCGQEIRVDGILTAIGAGWKYCPNCGAKMSMK